MADVPQWKKIKSDPLIRQRMVKRSAVLASIRRFFDVHEFLEVETPILVRHPGMEPNLDPLGATLKRDDGVEFPGFLITSPEYSMKKLLAGGLPRIFEITKCFRNGEPWSLAGAGEQGTHNPEFTMIEWYRADADYRAIMTDTEAMVSSVAREVVGSASLAYQGQPIELAAPWPRLTVAEAFDRYAGIDLGRGIDDPDRFRRAAADKGCQVSAGESFDDVYFKIFLRDIEPHLGAAEAGKPARPVILYEYPRSMAALARLKNDDRRYAERFEVYCRGLELGNAFSELNDAAEQRRRLEEESAERRRLHKYPYELDEQFIEAVAAMPDSAGIAFGIDRLVMLLTDAPSIRDVLFFPVSDLFQAGK
jgi:elongation factor P--(R)-beta-lysine ligase